ncbi:2-succinyl-5-enolpyruvyl-6-hydroxy-3-cyclohexene-1-carboxylic-acid synthase [Nakamurella flavida]|uniref:2-succinyl-5-enolpyruvyl-6-hydroxy-3-cyclohexene-1-carboxylate synthase n=1 Tax=Nakamurella flavida TaxID=363630 RepID=A0A938YDQ1_9ACTN|nr:2-succinyl-5-enolpyruvyl-6-hydroxy-3-cyclohexene-1-carboxylic-acid synthase [Nakamurella flavida]MBM9475791.1 2-succinyl-5-enolpyruvyl-6-hydroxy-3-cyclohexene-1-carboxylic-acid synthase [Nakamurella flavida]MDP9777928.1 2-succinyl-5-enolpyruvyl-6-hydroxy-3-cyclohexene-1-carboxylate synthase [Nakamurella flavida]
MRPSTAFAEVLVDELIRAGVREAVLSPGSRNAPLSLALHRAELAGRLRLHVRIDERTGAFLALGLARGSGRPAVVVTTSGTAVANLHPAVLEAHHGHVPLLVLSADRPADLRDVGANQVIDQRTVFGGALRLFHEFGEARPLTDPAVASAQNARWRSMVCRAVAAAGGAFGAPGPVQLDVPLVEPLLPDGTAAPAELAGRPDDAVWTAIGVPGPHPGAVLAPRSGERVLFLADLTDPRAVALASAGQVVVSEAGGAAGREVLAAGMHLLATPEFLAAHRPDRVVVLGRPTLFRAVTGLLADPAVQVDIVGPAAGFADPSGRAHAVLPGVQTSEARPDPVWADAWRAADDRAGRAVQAVLDDWDLSSSPRLARDVVAALPRRATLILGSSQAPRDVGLCSAGRNGITVLANRGVAGIDGMISTAIGAALAVPDSAAVALVGDLTFLHDATALVIGPREPRPDLTVVVSNNDGGGIFETLEPGAPEHRDAFERVFGTPPGVDLGGWVQACGADYVEVGGPGELAELVAAPRGLTVADVRTGRRDLRDQVRELHRAAAEAALDV